MADPDRIGPYRVIQRLGAGGMGEVVLAHDERLDRRVAIKRLHDHHGATPARRERFRREARIIARLDHAAIVQLHDVLHEGDHDYLIMEYIGGQTLRERCEAGQMTVSDVLAIAHQIALGMAAAHDAGVIHRDLKAENIVITPAGRAKITDFGIAKLHGDDPLTTDGVVVGTFRAMSPEQALGRAVDHRSDLFSFGILLYEALSGVSPFRAETPFLTVQRLVHDEPRPLAALVPMLPDSLTSLVTQLLAKEPMLRPRDFHEVADALIELAGQVCDAPCHSGSLTAGWQPLAGAETDDTEQTGDTDSTEHTRATEGVKVATDGAPLEPPPAHSPVAARRLTWRVAARRLTSRVAARRLTWRVTGACLAVVTTASIGFVVCNRARARALRSAPLVRVAVLDPGADVHPDIALLATSVRNAVMARVQARAGLDLVPLSDIESYVDGIRRETGRLPGAHSLAAAVGADEVLAIHLACATASCTISLERTPPAASGPPLAEFQLAADSVGHPGDTVEHSLAGLYPDHPVRMAMPTAARATIDPLDHARFVRLVHDYWAGRNAVSSDELLAELDAIHARSPGWLDVVLFEAEVRRHRYEQARDPEQAARAMAQLADADRQLPDTYGIVAARFDLALSANLLDEAHASLDRLAVLDPDSSATHLARAKFCFQVGDLESARRELDAASRRNSFSWRVLYYRARVARKLGDLGEARVAILQLLERSPGNYAGLSLLAHDNLDAGRLACAEALYAQLVAREPLFDECLNLGYLQTQLGRFRDAADTFQRALAVRPGDPAALLDLGEALELAGAPGAAYAPLRTLQDVLEHRRSSSPGGALTGDDRLIEAQALAYLGRDDRALADAARARATELGKPDAQRSALYTTALVHAVLGDRDLTAHFVTRYLDAGGSPAELGYRWFDDLRRDPVLGPRLVVPAFASSCAVVAAP